MSIFSVRARGLVLAVVAVSALATTTAAAVTTPQWNNYRWARSGPLSIRLGDNVASQWDPYLPIAASDWSAANNIDFVPVAGTSRASSCSAVYGTVQACSYNYGATGWLGLASVWLSGGYIVQATVKLNDYYFGSGRYNTTAFRQFVTCQEVGHTLGLGHINEVFTDPNVGSCMDYTNDPSGLLGTNGPLNNLHPYAGDFATLDRIYATPGGTQLSQTRPTLLAVHGYSINGEEFDLLSVIPEPSSWALLIAGFGLTGATMRRRRSATA